MPESSENAPSSVGFAKSTPPNVRWIMGALLIFGLLFPWLDQLAGWYRVSAAANSLLLIVLAVGLAIVVGFAGLLDLGYAAFFAIGGYTAAMLTSSGSQLALMLPEAVRSPWLALPVAGLVAAGFALTRAGGGPKTLAATVALTGLQTLALQAMIQVVYPV